MTDENVNDNEGAGADNGYDNNNSTRTKNDNDIISFTVIKAKCYMYIYIFGEHKFYDYFFGSVLSVCVSLQFWFSFDLIALIHFIFYLACNVDVNSFRLK